MKVDCHADTALYILEEESLRSLPQAQMDYLRVNEFLDLAFWAIFIDEGKYQEDTPARFARVLHLLNKDLTANDDLVMPLLNKEQLEEYIRNREEDPNNIVPKLILLVAEGASVLGNNSEFLVKYYSAGLRCIGPAWNYVNDYAGGSASSDGFTPAGLDLIENCNNKGILLDGAHLNRKSFWQMLEHSAFPFIVSHSCCAALSSKEVFQYRRNLDDDQMLALAQKGGVMGITFVPDFLGGAGNMERLLEHIEYAVDLIGSEHVALGSDFDGCIPHQELAGAEKLPDIYQGLAQRGMKEKDINNIAGQSVIELLKIILP